MASMRTRFEPAGQQKCTEPSPTMSSCHKFLYFLISTHTILYIYMESAFKMTILVQCLQRKGWADVPMLHLLHVNGLSVLSVEQSLQMLSLAFAPMIHFVHLNPVDPPVDPIPVLGFNATSSSSPIEF